MLSTPRRFRQNLDVRCAKRGGGGAKHISTSASTRVNTDMEKRWRPEAKRRQKLCKRQISKPGERKKERETYKCHHFESRKDSFTFPALISSVSPFSKSALARSNTLLANMLNVSLSMIPHKGTVHVRPLTSNSRVAGAGMEHQDTANKLAYEAWRAPYVCDHRLFIQHFLHQASPALLELGIIG